MSSRARMSFLLTIGLLASIWFCGTKTKAKVTEQSQAEVPESQRVGLCVKVDSASQSVVAAQVEVSSGDPTLDDRAVHDVIGWKTPVPAKFVGPWMELWVTLLASDSSNEEDEEFPEIDCTRLNREVCGKDAC